VQDHEEDGGRGLLALGRQTPGALDVIHRSTSGVLGIRELGQGGVCKKKHWLSCEAGM
jgi:hypothetical protein